MYSAYYRHVVKAEKIGERDVKFTFDAPGNRELPQIVGAVDGAAEALVGRHRQRGPQARHLARPRWRSRWAPVPTASRNSSPAARSRWSGSRIIGARSRHVNVGQNNFDELRFEYFRDTTVALEAFKADQVDWRTENSAKNWATAYDFPAVTEKRVVLEEFPNRSSGLMQAFALNMRRDKFKDRAGAPRVQLRVRFRGDEQAALLRPVQAHQQLFRWHRDWHRRGLPQGKELEILETVRDKVPPEVFTTAYTNPVGGNPEAVRDNLREALRLLKEAGYEVRDRKLVDARPAAPFTVELLVPGSELRAGHAVLQAVAGAARHRPSASAPSIRRNMRTGCAAWISISSSSSWGESLSPGNEQREFWGSQAADMAGLAQHHRHQESGDRQADRTA